MDHSESCSAQPRARAYLLSVRERQEGITHGRGCEPLVPCNRVLSGTARAREQLCCGGVAAHVTAALLLRHGHTHRATKLVVRGDVARVIAAATNDRHSLH